jgi:hypothetical protein
VSAGRRTLATLNAALALGKTGYDAVLARAWAAARGSTTTPIAKR